MALNVKFLQGTAAKYQEYISSSKIEATNFYYIDEKDLYLGLIKLSNADDLLNAVSGIVGPYGEGQTPATIYALEQAMVALGMPEGKTVQDLIDAAIADTPKGKYYDVSSLDEITEPVEGDVAIVTTTENGIEFKTAYHYAVVDGGFAWKAMAGNYSAANVYTDTAITLSGDYGSVYDTADKKYYSITTIGNKKIGDTIAAGTSIQSLFSDILSKRIQPTVTANPSATISASGSDGSKEVGDTYTKPTATITVKTGSYTNEGVATGVKFETGKVIIAYGADPDAEGVVKNSNTSELVDGGTVNLGPSSYASDATTATFTDTTVNYTFSGKAGHTAGNVAKDNLGSNSDPEIKIDANSSLTVTDKTVGFRGYRRTFVGCTDVANDSLTSSDIRGLNLYKENSTTNGVKASTAAFEVTAPIGATKLVIAAPTNSCGKAYTLSKAEMFTMSYEDYTGKFNKDAPLTVSVNGKGDSGNAQNYNVYYYSFTALETPTKFKITLK